MGPIPQMPYEELVRAHSQLWAQVQQFKATISLQQTQLQGVLSKNAALQNLVGAYQQQLAQMEETMKRMLRERQTLSPRVQRAPDSVSLPLRPIYPAGSAADVQGHSGGPTANPLLIDDET